MDWLRKIVNSHLKEVARNYLITQKNQHKKLNPIKNDYKFEPYLTSTNLSTDEKQTLFKFRTRMVEVKTNFKDMHANTTCRKCHSEEENLEHVLSCQRKVPENKKEVVQEVNNIINDINKTEDTKLRSLAEEIYSAVEELKTIMVLVPTNPSLESEQQATSDDEDIR